MQKRTRVCKFRVSTFRFVASVALLCPLGGCLFGPYSIPGLLNELESDRVVLGELLPVLQGYAADHDAIPEKDHPMANVVAGAIIANAASIDGCWVMNIDIDVDIDDPNLGIGDYTYRLLELIKIDQANGTLLQYWLTELPSDVAAFQESLYFFPEPQRDLLGLVGWIEFQLTMESDNSFLLEPVYAGAGNYDANGGIGFGDTSLFAASYAISTHLRGFFTVEGDYLKLSYLLIEPNDPGPSDPDNYDGMYERVDCDVIP